MKAAEVVLFVRQLREAGRLGRIRDKAQGLEVEILYGSSSPAYRLFPDVILMKGLDGEFYLHDRIVEVLE